MLQKDTTPFSQLYFCAVHTFGIVMELLGALIFNRITQALPKEQVMLRYSVLQFLCYLGIGFLAYLNDLEFTQNYLFAFRGMFGFLNAG